MEEAHTYKREKYLNLTKELRDSGCKAIILPVEVGARGFIGLSVCDLPTNLSIYDRKITKALKSLAETAENSPGGSRAGEMRCHWIRIRNAIGSAVSAVV